MHKNKIIHRDLKLGNLFISENMEIKIGDFGLATNIQYEGERKHTICGTPNYIAPEILEGKSGGHSYEVDFWAIGVIIYTLIIGRPPFETDDVKETYKRIQEINYAFPNHIYISEEGRDIIEKVLVMNPLERLNLDGMRSHPFMTKTTIPKIMPQYTSNFPPNAVFYRKLKGENIKNISDLSTLTDSQDSYYDDLIKFSKRNLLEVNRKNLVCDDLVFDKNVKQELEKLNSNINKGFNANQTHAAENKLKQNNNINNTSNLNVDKLTKSLGNLNISQTKESHRLVNIKSKSIDLKSIQYIGDIVDYSNDFGYLYKIKTNLIGVYFNDKSSIFKDIDSNEFFFLNRRSNHMSLKTPQKFNFVENPNDIPTEIKHKFEILKNYETYIGNESSSKTKVNLLIYCYLIFQRDFLILEFAIL